jgi:DNA polymerase III subunit epsilon
VRRSPSWRDAELIVVDLETTGLDAHTDEIVSFGAVPVTGGRLIARDAVYGLVRPERELSRASIEIHGIRRQDLADAPRAPEALRPLADAIGDRQVVAQAAWVERSFLQAPLRALGRRPPRNLIDTAVLWRLLCIDRGEPDPGFTQLGRLAEALGLPAHHPHHALGDALTTAQVFLALATHLETFGRGTIRALVRANQPVEQHVRLYGPAKRT